MKIIINRDFEVLIDELEFVVETNPHLEKQYIYTWDKYIFMYTDSFKDEEEYITHIHYLNDDLYYDRLIEGV